MKKITIAMKENTHEWLRAQAARKGISVSHGVRNLVDPARATQAASFARWPCSQSARGKMTRLNQKSVSCAMTFVKSSKFTGLVR